MKAYAITAKGQVTIPVSLREELNLKPNVSVKSRALLLTARV
jgi:bifunctional DNA-binding transcriptional regulator/antitoxin component of YhaV-PrlF toxin-antitoxin module